MYDVGRSQPVTGDGAVTNGVVPHSGPVNFPPGTFFFQANYSGDANNLVPAGGLKSVCASEPLTVVDANIQITPDATNQVGHPHTFTATVSTDTGGGQHVGAGGDCNITLTHSNGAVATPAGPFTTTDANGQCFATFTSSSAGQVLGSASASLTVAGAQLTRSTDGTANNSGPATKVFQDVTIKITPDAHNWVNQNHTFTAAVYKNAGDGNGYQPQAEVHVTVTLTPSNGAAPVPAGEFQRDDERLGTVPGHVHVGFREDRGKDGIDDADDPVHERAGDGDADDRGRLCRAGETGERVR